MNANELKLKHLTDEIRYYETENPSVQQYLNLKKQREVILDDLRHRW